MKSTHMFAVLAIALIVVIMAVLPAMVQVLDLANTTGALK